MSPRMNPTTNSSTVRASMPISSADTAPLLTRSLHLVDIPTNSACARSTNAVTNQVTVVVPS